MNSSFTGQLLRIDRTIVIAGMRFCCATEPNRVPVDPSRHTNYAKSRIGMSTKSKVIQGCNCLVTRSWTAVYPDPIKVAAGEPIELDGRADVWDGHTWLWAKNTEGKEGWVPDCIISTGRPAHATEDYSAVELTCTIGQTLSAKRVMHGWVWCSNSNGEVGWVPERNLRPIDGREHKS